MGERCETVGDWFRTNVVDAGKLPLFLCLVAFTVTFIATRVIVRSIRAGRGPFHDNAVGGVHVHHMVPGIIAMIVGGLLALGAAGRGLESLSGVVFGAGLALVLDEFALLFHLQDVYWEEEGRLSVDVVMVLAAVMALLLLVGSPTGAEEVHDKEVGARIVFTSAFGLNLVAAAIAALKGKLGTAVVGVVVPIVAYVGAIRIARPRSPWAHKAYGDKPHKLEKSERRETSFDARWRSKVDRFQDLVAGRPSDEPT